MKTARETLAEVRKEDRRRDALGKLREAHHQQVMYAARSRHQAKRARQAGASWAEIGDIVGITRQAAEQRYGK